MFCRQCEQTSKGIACTVKGICGKTNEVANLQDLLIVLLEEISFIVLSAKNTDKELLKKANKIVRDGLFSTITNVNFDESRMIQIIKEAEELKKELLNATELNSNKIELIPFLGEKSKDEILKYSQNIKRIPDENEDLFSLKEILLFGLKGMAAYAHHADLLGFNDENVNSFFYKGLNAIFSKEKTQEEIMEIIQEFGLINLNCLELLDKAHTFSFGHPEPTKINVGVKKGPAIIVSGHDLLDLKNLLEQTKNTGINIYTHGEMLPALAYPKLKSYEHLTGHFGTAWQNQRKEFDNIPSAILMTTNCIQEPLASYEDRIFTTGLVAFPNVYHIEEKNGQKDFAPIIKKALQLKGFEKNNIQKTITIGFGHNAILSNAAKILEKIKEGKIKHIFLIGGCDGAKPGRNYYTDLAQKTPNNSLVLTLACGKFRINNLDLGNIDEFPRLLDCGQCNDAYSAIKVASELSKALNCSINDLPLTLILSWYEQKAVCILLTLLSLGIKNIKLGPSLPAFVSKNVLKVLSEKFNLKQISNAEEDIKEALSK